MQHMLIAIVTLESRRQKCSVKYGVPPIELYMYIHHVYFYCSAHIKVWLDSLMNSLVATKLMTFLMKVRVLYPGCVQGTKPHPPVLLCTYHING